MKTLFTVLILAMHCNAFATEFFVSTEGNDEAPGTRSSPFRTLNHAVGMAKEGDTVVIRGGIYRESLTMRRSGTKTHPITFKPDVGAQVIVTGADPVGDWKPYKGAILQAKLRAALGRGFNQLFLDGRMMHQARFPNEQQHDLLRPTFVSMKADDGRINSPALTQSDGYWKGGYVVGGFSHRWAFQCAEITEYTNGTLVLGQKSAPWFTGDGQGYVSGVLAALDAPGEWHIDGLTLYFWPPEGTDMATASVELKQRTLCVDFNGQSHIRVNGLAILSGTVRMVGDSNVFEDCTVSFPSHFTFFPWSGYASDGGADSGHNGILVQGDDNVVRDCTIRYSAGSGIVLRGARNLITLCEISDISYSGTYSAPITVRDDPERTVGNNRIWFNTIRRSGRDCVQLYGSSADDIRYNDISESGQLCKDAGIIYAWGRDGNGTRIAYNWIHDNRAKGPNPGVYLDNYCSNFIVDHNVIWNCEAGVRVNGPAKGHRVYNNTLFQCGDVGTHTYNQWPKHLPEYWKRNGYENIYEYDGVNNLFLGRDPASQLEDVEKTRFCPKEGVAAIDAGKDIPGFTDGFAGKMPDLGAYERGRAYWLPGKNGRAEQSPAGDALEAAPEE